VWAATTDKVEELFNVAVLENDLKWAGWMANPDRALTALEWLANTSILTRGHNLLWPSYRFMPPAAQGLDAAQLDAFIRDHFADELNHTRGQRYQWDVINKPYSNYDVQGEPSPYNTRLNFAPS
jgi:GH35 family endo-1,4-beta-xylanase